MNPSVLIPLGLAACIAAGFSPLAAQAAEAGAAKGTAASAAAAPAPTALAPSPAFATVGTTTITVAEYQRALAVATRKKYYHAKPPEAEFARFQREVANDIVNRVLLLDEARRRGVEPDRDQIARTVAGYDRQYANSANWKANRETMLAAVLPQLETESRLERLESQVRNVGEPTEAQLRAYYDGNKPLFVEPEQVKLAVILLKVDPSSRRPVWEAAHSEARQIFVKLKGGGDFAEAARLHSGDRSAQNGGAMEYTHRGMLPEPVQALIDKLKIGEIAEPVQLLEGVVILRLDGKRAAQQRTLDQVRERAVGLWKRERADAAWAAFIEGLRKGVAIRIDESLYAPAPRAGDKPKAG